MSRIKVVFAGLVVTAMAALVPSASATTSKGQVVMTGSSGVWQAVGVGAFNAGNCPAAKVKVHPPCFHYTDNAKFNLTDSRPKKVPKARGGPGTPAVDQGDIWMIWDSPTGTQVRNVWTYIKVDTIVGNRCFFANPVCTISAPSGYVWTTTGAQKIASSLWGADTVPPTDVQALFTSATGLKVNAAASDVRPEDALFEECRVNSALGNGTINGGGDDGLDGLGYNPNNPAGTCPVFNSTKTALGQLVGVPIKSGTTSSIANVLAFNISGKDPFTNLAIPASTVIDVGANALVFVFSRKAALSGLTTANATTQSLQTLFSGTNCDASLFGLAPGAVNAYLREPLSGTMDATEATVFRLPLEVPGGVNGVSQESHVGSINPLSATPCLAGAGVRYRGIGTGEVVGDVQTSPNGNDGVAYSFYSFGNFSKLAGSSNYGYFTLDGQDPIGIATTNQQLPVCNAPCPETSLWTGGLSFPAMRAGNYAAWSLIRAYGTATSIVNVQDLINTVHATAVNLVPDFVPVVGVPTGCTGSGCQDPGMQILRTHYQQFDGNGAALGPAPSNGTFNSNNNPVSGDTGGDMGGCVKATPLTDDFGFIEVQSGSSTTCSNAAVR